MLIAGSQKVFAEHLQFTCNSFQISIQPPTLKVSIFSGLIQDLFNLSFRGASSRGCIFKTSRVLQLRNQDCWPICSHFSVQKLKQCALLRSPMVVVNYVGCHGWLWISISFLTSAEGGGFQTTVYRWCLRNNRWGLRKSS